MREIKFRAWDKKLKKMFEFELEWSKYVNHEEIQCLTPVGIGNPNEENIKNPSDFMQYTGLKDRNGKEIYEGDILVTLGLTTRKVEWNEEYSSFGLSEKIDDKIKVIGIHKQLAEKSEVIGNIYENPELMEDNGRD